MLQTVKNSEEKLQNNKTKTESIDKEEKNIGFKNITKRDLSEIKMINQQENIQCCECKQRKK